MTEIKIKLSELTDGIHKGVIIKANSNNLNYSQSRQYVYDARNVDCSKKIWDEQYFNMHIILEGSLIGTTNKGLTHIQPIPASLINELCNFISEPMEFKKEQ